MMTAGIGAMRFVIEAQEPKSSHPDGKGMKRAMTNVIAFLFYNIEIKQ